MPHPFKVHRSSEGDIAVLHLEGFLDAHTAPVVEQAIQTELDAGHVRLVVSGEKVFIFLQKPGRPFATSVTEADQTLDAGGHYLSILLADYNGDGTPDLMVWDGQSFVKGYANTGKGIP